jgi:pilus assembly protein Flp/PilA
MTQLTMLYLNVVGWFQGRARDERGASLVEYALLLVLIAVVAIAGLTFLGHTVNNTFNNVAGNLQNP